MRKMRNHSLLRLFNTICEPRYERIAMHIYFAMKRMKIKLRYKKEKYKLLKIQTQNLKHKFIINIEINFIIVAIKK